MGYCKISRHAALLLILALTALPPAYCAGKQTGQQSAISQMETKLFFKTYPDDTDEVRVARLEKEVFGSSSPGPLADRLQRLSTAVAPQVNPDGTMSGVTPPAAPQQQAPAQPSAEEQARQDQEAAIQRAQVEVQAAREREIIKLLGEGVQLWQAKRHREAVDRFEQVLRLDPRNPEANFSMGIAYESQNNFVEALAAYKIAAEEKPQNKDYHDAVGAVERKLQAKGKVQDKQNQLQGELRQLAEDAQAAYNRGEYLSALDLYKQLDMKAPNEALVKYNIGTIYLRVNNPISALDYYQQAVRLKPAEQRYVQARDQLEKSVKAAEQQRMASESAWNAYEQSGGANNGGRSMSAMQPPPGAADTAAGNTSNTQAAPQKHHKDKKSSNNGFAPNAVASKAPAAGDPMSTYGLIGKSTHDGIEITAVGIASRASRVGLLKGDIIKAADGTVVNRTSELNAILSRKAGAPVQLTIQRGQQMGQVSL